VRGGGPSESVEYFQLLVFLRPDVVGSVFVSVYGGCGFV